jgi:hypothetical protein
VGINFHAIEKAKTKSYLDTGPEQYAGLDKVLKLELVE